MKKIALLIALCSIYTSLSAQSDDTIQKRIRFGFNISPNISFVLAKDKLPRNAEEYSGIGFRVGGRIDYSISKIMSISHELNWSYNYAGIIFTDSSGAESNYEVMPVSLDVMTHAIFKKQNNTVSPYFLIGPSLKIPIGTPNNTLRYGTNVDFAINTGVGIDWNFKYFSFAPELRYSFGLLNVNQHPEISSLHFHNVSLAFNFMRKN